MNTKHFFLTAIAAVLMTACSVDEFEKNESPQNSGTLRIQVTTEEVSPKTRVAYSKENDIITASFTEGDEIGVYAVNGTTVVASNIKFTLNAGGDWIAASSVEFNPDYYYYAYYPWVSSPGSFNNASAPDASSDDTDTKMSSIISGWTVYDDQSTKENYRKSDLLAARGTQQSIPVVKFTLAHKMAMAQLIPSYNKFYYAYNPGTTYDMQIAYSAKKPYEYEGNAYFIMKPGVANSVGTENFAAGDLVSGKLIYKRISSISGSSYTLSYSTDGSSYTSGLPSWLSVSKDNSTYTTLAVGFGTAGKGSGSSGTSISSWTAPASVAEYDLSTHDVNGNPTGRNTANSYMVHKSGTYKLPLVYGNAIKNGVTNTAAFNPGGSSTSTYLSQFVNHNGSPIVDPWLKNNGAAPDEVQLLWQDSPGIISSVSLDGDYLRFTVGTSAPMGNAVIAVKKNGVICWSWHIWCCPDVYTSKTQTTINTGNHIYTVTPMNLGWVGDFTATDYTGGDCWIKVTPTSSGAEQIFKITLPTATQYAPSSNGYQPYFQFGRKDPEIPSNAITNSSPGNKTVYNISGTAVTGLTHVTFDDETVGINTGIQNPTIHYFNNQDGHAGRYGPFKDYQYNLWDAKQTGTGNIKTATVKTIYDPCPPGYCVPTGNLWYYISGNAGVNSSEGSSWGNTYFGRTWTANFPNIYFPASGHRYSYGGATLSYISTHGYCWSSSASSGNNGHNLRLHESAMYWYSDLRANGFPVRPVVEE